MVVLTTSGQTRRHEFFVRLTTDQVEAAIASTSPDVVLMDLRMPHQGFSLRCEPGQVLVSRNRCESSNSPIVNTTCCAVWPAVPTEALSKVFEALPDEPHQTTRHQADHERKPTMTKTKKKTTVEIDPDVPMVRAPASSTPPCTRSSSARRPSVVRPMERTR